MTRWREPAPGEREAADRGWEVVRSAFEERIPVPRKRATGSWTSRLAMKLMNVNAASTRFAALPVFLVMM